MTGDVYRVLMKVIYWIYFLNRQLQLQLQQQLSQWMRPWWCVLALTVHSCSLCRTNMASKTTVVSSRAQFCPAISACTAAPLAGLPTLWGTVRSHLPVRRLSNRWRSAVTAPVAAFAEENNESFSWTQTQFLLFLYAESSVQCLKISPKKPRFSVLKISKIHMLVFRTDDFGDEEGMTTGFIYIFLLNSAAADVGHLMLYAANCYAWTRFFKKHASGPESVFFPVMSPMTPDPAHVLGYIGTTPFSVQNFATIMSSVCDERMVHLCLFMIWHYIHRIRK